MDNNPSGLTQRDTLEDAFARADWAATPDGRIYSGVMLHNKDLRRVVLLTREVRQLTAERDRYKAALTRLRHSWPVEDQTAWAYAGEVSDIAEEALKEAK